MVASQQASMAPGDVVLLRCGDTFRENVTITRSGLTLAAYNDSRAPSALPPRIAGTVEVPSQLFTQTNKAGFVKVPVGTAVAAATKQLFVNEERQILARYPNVGSYRNFTAGIAATLLVDANLPAAMPGVDWTGATVRFKDSKYTFQSKNVTAYSAGSMTVAAGGYEDSTVGWGYYLDGVAAAADANGEWYRFSSTELALAAAQTGTNGVEAAVLDYGVIVAAADVTIANVSFFGQNVYGVRVQSAASRFLLSDCRLSAQLAYGVVIDAADAVVRRCQLDNVCGQAIAINGNGTLVEECAISDTGMVPGYGLNGVNGASAVVLSTGTGNVTIRRNVLQRAGYIQVRFDGQSHVVEQNVVTDACQTLDDCGALYAWGVTSSGSTLSHNLVSGAAGSLAGNPPGIWGPLAAGIYLDDRSSHASLVNNTLWNNVYGVFVHNHPYALIQGNVLLNNSEGQVRVAEDNIVGAGGLHDTVIRNNTAHSLQPDSPVLSVGSSATGGQTAALVSQSDYNTLVNPFVRQQLVWAAVSGSLSLAGWQAATGGLDAHSVSPTLHWLQYTYGYEAEQLLPNSNFAQNISGWTSWNDSSAVSWALPDAKLDNRTALAFDGSTTATLIYNTAPFLNTTITADTWYVLTGLALLDSDGAPGRSEAADSLSEIVLRLSVAPYSTLARFTGQLLLNSDSALPLELLALCANDSTETRLDFAISTAPHTGFRLANLALHRAISVRAIDERQRVLLLTNPSDLTRTVTLPSKNQYTDVLGNALRKSVRIAPWSSTIIHAIRVASDACPNSCSGNGDCLAAICSCNVGYYGVDCFSTDPADTNANSDGAESNAAASNGGAAALALLLLLLCSLVSLM